MGTVYVFLAEGFEEIEALTPVDFLRRAGVEVKTVAIGANPVKGGQGIQVMADIAQEDFTLPQDAAMVLLPGGGLGTQNLGGSALVQQALQAAGQRGIYIAAICAAPTVLHKYGLLQGKTATAYPDVQPQLTGSNVTGAGVEVDGNIITARSAGVALQFAHTLAAIVAGAATADEVLESLYP